MNSHHALPFVDTGRVDATAIPVPAFVPGSAAGTR